MKSPSADVSVVIPSYNESIPLGHLLRELLDVLPEAEIIVVDDGSTDDTNRIACDAGVRVIRHPRNLGNGAAVKTGLRAATRPRVVMMDGDGQHRACDVPALIDRLDEYNMVVAERSFDGQAGWHRHLANSVYNWLASYVTEFPVRDLTSGFRSMRRSDVVRFIELLPNTFSYPTTLTLAFLRSGLAVHYQPTEIQQRVGTSKIRLWKDGSRFFLILTRIATLFSPMRVFLPVSLAFFVTGLSYYGYTFLTEHRFTNMAALLLSTSVIIFMLGLVSEQIALMRVERIASEGALPPFADDVPRETTRPRPVKSARKAARS